jgi:hypothetical protein
MLGSTLSPDRARLRYAMKLEHLHGGILLRCGVYLHGKSRGVFIGSQGRSCGKNWARGGATEGSAGHHMWLASQVLGANRPLCLGFFITPI